MSIVHMFLLFYSVFLHMEYTEKYLEWNLRILKGFDYLYDEYIPFKNQSILFDT
jgi:hypothetical protein